MLTSSCFRLCTCILRKTQLSVSSPPTLCCAPFMIPSLARDLEMPSLCENLRPRRLLLICTHSDLMLTQINSHPKMVWRHNAAFCGPVSQKRPSGPFLKCLPPSTANVVERLERVFYALGPKHVLRSTRTKTCKTLARRL